MELTQEMIVGAATVMAGAIVWLARNQIVSQRRCEREGTECRTNLAALDGFIRERLMGIASENAADRATAIAELTRARRVIERNERPNKSAKTNDETPLSPQRIHG